MGLCELLERRGRRGKGGEGAGGIIPSACEISLSFSSPFLMFLSPWQGFGDAQGVRTANFARCLKRQYLRGSLQIKTQNLILYYVFNGFSINATTSNLLSLFGCVERR